MFHPCSKTFCRRVEALEPTPIRGGRTGYQHKLLKVIMIVQELISISHRKQHTVVS